MKRRVQSVLERAGIAVGGDRPWDIQVHDERLWRRVALLGNIGFGDAYMDGWWDCAALDQLVERLLGVVTAGERQPWPVRLAGSLLAAACNLQSRGRAFLVGRRHYDIGNDLYQAMLGPELVYSCAYWQGGATTLAEAQRDKLELVCRKLRLAPGMRVLDIGCGWGSFCRHAAVHHGVEAVGLTVSVEQARLARAQLAGLPVEIRLEDYRAATGQFDRIVSIGMFEHVGPRNYATFMDVARRCLKPDGLFLLHTIGGNETNRSALSWYTKHIFPNGHIPSIAQIGRAAEGRFVVEDLHNFGPDYDRTLMAWHANFERAWPELQGRRPAYTERFRRMWRFYLLSCAGAFRARDEQLWQWVLSPRGVPGGWRRP